MKKYLVISQKKRYYLRIYFSFYFNLNFYIFENINSAILREFKIIDELLKLCEFPEQIKLRLLYRASIDGFSARSFHSKCDGFQKTLVIVKSEDFSVFGGYTEEDWAGHGYATDNNAFIFSLINQDNKPLKLKCIKSFLKTIIIYQ